MSASNQLYQEVILDHNRKPRNWGAVVQPSHRAEGHNPLCGDHIKLTLKLDGEQIAEIAFEGDGCAICKASSSMMTTGIKGRTRADAEQMVQEFRDMALGRLDVAAGPHHLGRLTVFAGVRDLPSRVKCAILPWHTLHAALNAQTSASTESDNDPVPGSGTLA
jgi:nitrogen fixation NifU-like protein